MQPKTQIIAARWITTVVTALFGIYAVRMDSPKEMPKREDSDIESETDDGPEFTPAEEIDIWDLPQSLGSLALFDGDPYLNMQATNLGLIDRWLIDMESDVQRELISEERTPPSTIFLSALTQMWIFAMYELMRTWRQRVKDVLKLVENSGLELKIRALEEKLGYQHFGRELRVTQLRAVRENPELAVKIEKDLRRTHIIFAQLESLRIALAKHEVRGRPNMIAMDPGYARIDDWTGSLTYELGSGRDIMGYISRREISDAIRAIPHDSEPQSLDTLVDFDRFMKGPPSDPKA